MQSDPETAPPTRVELDQYVRELRRLSSARRVPEAAAGTSKTRPGLSRHELRVLRRTAAVKRTRPSSG